MAGLLCNLLAFVLCVLYVQPTTFGGEATEPWLFVAVGVLLLTYQALDNIDGKQARR